MAKVIREKGNPVTCRYLEKVLPSPYGPRLPWWFPFSRSYWATGDVEDGLHAMAPVQRVCSRLKKLLRLKDGQEDTAAYQQVRSSPWFCQHNAHDHPSGRQPKPAVPLWQPGNAQGVGLQAHTGWPCWCSTVVHKNHRCTAQWGLRQVTLLHHHGQLSRPASLPSPVHCKLLQESCKQGLRGSSWKCGFCWV